MPVNFYFTQRVRGSQQAKGKYTILKCTSARIFGRSTKNRITSDKKSK